MKSQRFNFSKVLLTFMFILLTSLVLVACGDSDQDLVDEALNTVAITYGSGDTQDSVTKNLTLPQTIGEVTVTWTSGNPDVITNAGVVTRPEEDTEVTLTATLTLDDAEESVQIKVTVKAAEAVTTPEEALAAIEITGDTVELVGSVYETTSDIVLPATSLGLNITWTTSNANYVAIDGSVTRPNFGIADQVVTLTATINGEEAQFLVKVLAFTEKPVSQILDEAKVALLLDGISGGVATDLDLPATVGSQGVTVTWSSSDAAVIANDGTVTRPAMGSDDVTVTLTATLSLSGESVTKEFPILVLANVEPTLYASVADVLENAAAGDFVKVEDVTVVGLTVDSYLFADSTGILAVYFGDEPTVEVGTVYDIYGLFDVYNGSPQLNNTSDSTMPSVATESDGAVTTLTPTVVDDIDAFVQDTAPSYSASNLLEYQYLEITAKVRIQGDGNYDMFFVNTDYTGGDINSDANSPHTTNAIMMYYRSNKAAFNTYDGKEVTFNAFLFSYRSDRNIYTIVFTGDAEDITYNATDAEAVEMAKVELGTMFEYEYIEAETLDLITTSEIGATIAWSSDSLLVDPLTGALTMPVTGQEDVTLTATITKGTEVGTFTVTITVGELPNSTIAEAIALGTGHLVEVTGVVTSAEYQNTYFIQDETGGIAIYTSWGDLETFLQTNINKEITIIGERAVYNGLIQLSGIKSYELVGDPAAPIAEVNVDEHHLDSASLEPFQGQLVELTGLIVIDVYEHPTYSNIEVTLVDSTSGKEIVMKWDARVTLSTAAQATIDAIEVADVLDIINPLAWNKAPYLYFTDTTVITEGTLTDVAAVAAAKATLEVDVDQPIVEDETLVLSDAYLGTTITWASDNTDVITNAGVVTVPADNKQVTVTLTATITKGTETDTKVFEILVGDITPITTAIGAEVGDEIKVQGVVIAMEYNRTYFITDESGSIVIYTANEDLQAIFEANYGKEVVVTGTRSEYNGMRQIAPTTVEALSTGSLPTATNLDAVAITSEAMDMYQGMLVELSNLYVFDVYIDQYDNATIKLSRPAAGEEIVLKFSSYGTLTEAASTALYAIEVGDVLNITTVLAWNKGPELYYTSSTILSEGTLTDADKAAIDAADLDVDAAFAEATTITLPTTGDQGSSIAWTSSDDTIINATTGAVVLPTEGQVLVTLTATVTVGTEEVQVIFESFVGTPVPDLFFSEYIEGGSSNKALEIFNPLDVAVDLADYKVVLYANGATAPGNTLTFTEGTMLASGEVYVIYNSSAAQAIIDQGDVESSVTYFNGDDAVALVKIEGETERPIDIIGKIGEDPGSSWTVGTGSTADYTLVRKETINMPNLVFTANEWEVYPKDEFTYLGSHTMNIPTGGQTYTQDFSALTTVSSSYTTPNAFTDANDFDWDLVSRVDAGTPILGNAADGSYIQVTATGGVDSITFEVVRAFTNTNVRSGEVLVNGVSVGTFNVDVSSDTVQVITIEDINVTGEVIIKIVTTSPGSRGAYIVDNLEWTSLS
jgi:predicted extracellular nuclease